MLRAGGGCQQKATPRSWNLLVFSVGGRRLSVKTEEVSGISRWKGSIPVPSRTPYILSVIREHDSIWPVFDLAGLLRLSVQGDRLLCLIAKHPRGAMAVCIDGEMPVLRTLDAADVHGYEEKDVPSFGSFSNGLEEVPIISLSKLGSA